MEEDFEKINSLLSTIELVLFDFDGVFTDNKVTVSDDGTESVTCWRSDGIGLSKIKSLGIRVALISSEKNSVVSMRAEKIELPCLQGIEDKREAVLSFCKKFSIDPSKTIFVGNDINDIPAFECVGLPIAVNDAYPEVFPYVRIRTKRQGGQGAVREICDNLYRSRKGAKRE